MADNARRRGTVGKQAKLTCPGEPEQRVPLRLRLRLIRRLAQSKAFPYIRWVARGAWYRKVLTYANNQAIYTASPEAVDDWVREAVAELQRWESLGHGYGRWTRAVRTSKAVAPPLGVNENWWDSVFHHCAMALWAVHLSMHVWPIEYSVIDFLDGLGMDEDWPHRHCVQRVLEEFFPAGTFSAHTA
jgi:hypothetical protein